MSKPYTYNVEVEKDWHYMMTQIEDKEMCSYDTIAFEGTNWQHAHECPPKLLLVALLHRSEVLSQTNHKVHPFKAWPG
jgi:hypothetical protein